MVFFYKKIIFLFLFSFFISSFNLWSQEGIKVVKIDNSNFPFIEIFLRVDNNVNPDHIIVYEEDKKVDFVKDTIASKEIKKGRSVLFVIEQNAKENINTTLINSIRRLSGSDKINLGYILKDDTTNQYIHYVSPTFSYNHEFFINILEQKLYKNILYNNTRKTCKNIEKIEDALFSSETDNLNQAVIFIAEKLKYKKGSCSKLLEKQLIPTYIILTSDSSEKDQKDLIRICTKSGGILTVIDDKELNSKLNFYMEDISLNINQKKTELYRITFETQQNKEKNIFKLVYNNQSNNYLFTRPGKKLFSNRDYYLLILLGFLILIIIIYQINRKAGKKNAEKSKSQVNVIQKSSLIKPIEINVKTEGFSKTFFFEKHIIKIGRTSDNDIIIQDRTVSSSHAVINKEGDDYMIQDLGSTNGVLVNQKKIKKQKLQSKDKIKLGAAILVVQF